MKPIFREVILWAAIAWGIIMLAVGFFASFSIGAHETAMSLIIFFLFFGLPIVASIAARWLPSVSGVVLLLSVVVALIWIYAVYSI